MADYPTDFSDELIPLLTEGLGSTGLQAINALSENGYTVCVGLTPEMAEQIAIMSLEPHIQEYCPNDSRQRFKDNQSAKAWLSKGRATFLLLKQASDKQQLVGYGWCGNATSSKAPGGKTTFALRLGAIGQGQGLARPFSQSIISGSANLYASKDFWLEAWQSNGGAVHIYQKLGFRQVGQEAGQRQRPDGSLVADTRLYMDLPNSLLPPT